MLEILHSPKLSERTSLRLGGSAVAEITVREAVDVLRLNESCLALGGSPWVMGRGSNVLAHDGELPVVLIRPAFCGGPSCRDETEKTVLVRVGSGVRLAGLLGYCAREGLSGLEGLCGIPGTVGGAVAMNAGSFGCETCGRLHSVRVYSPAVGIQDVSAQFIDFSYRHMEITGLNTWFVIVQATFALTRDAMNGITKTMRRNFFQKKSTQPVTAWTAGCAFKNPSPQQHAGMLLEQAGMKGKKLGGMAFSPVHANFLVNEGSGTATAALELLEMAREAVLAHSGIQLEREIQVIPCR